MTARYGLIVCPHFRDWCGRYYPPALRALAHLGDQYAPRLLVLPEDRQALPAGALYEARLQLPRGSYLVGFTGSSSETAGFQVQATQGSRPLASCLINHSNITGGQSPSPQGLYNPQFILPKPVIVTQPGFNLRIQIKNLATVSNTVELVAFVAVPKAELQ